MITITRQIREIRLSNLNTDEIKINNNNYDIDKIFEIYETCHDKKAFNDLFKVFSDNMEFYDFVFGLHSGISKK